MALAERETAFPLRPRRIWIEKRQGQDVASTGLLIVPFSLAMIQREDRGESIRVTSLASSQREERSYGLVGAEKAFEVLLNGRLETPWADF